MTLKIVYGIVRKGRIDNVACLSVQLKFTAAFGKLLRLRDDDIDVFSCKKKEGYRYT